MFDHSLHHRAHRAHQLARLILVVACCIATVALVGLVKAEGSRDMIGRPPTSVGGSRAFLEWRQNSQNFGINRQTTIKAYVRSGVGEQIYLGSSAMNLGPSGNIVYRGPGGVTGDCRALSQNQPADYGRIDNRTEEVNGPLPAANGYTPCIIPAATVNQAGSGIWEFDFISPNPAVNNDPSPTLVDDNWEQSVAGSNPPNYDVSWVAAWDVSVRSVADQEIAGRVFANYLALNAGSNGRNINSRFYILTDDGFGYQVRLNGIDPYGFIFFANAEGVLDNRGNPIYRSLQLVNGNPGDAPPGYSLHNPALADNAATRDITYKIFFDLNGPDPSMPTTAVLPNGTTTWLVVPPAASATPTGFTFTGSEGTPGQMGLNPLGGNFSFNAATAGTYRVIIDLNNNGTFGDGNDRILSGSNVRGLNTVAWDGLDGAGNAVSASATTYQARVELLSGEVHFPFIDPENNPTGIVIERVRDPNSATVEPDPFLVYYNDEYGYDGTSAYLYTLCGTAQTPEPPDTGIAAPRCYGTGPDPRNALAGISSAAGAHSWSDNFGDRRLMDTWANYPSDAQLLIQPITVASADLAIVKSHSPATLVPGRAMSYSLVVTNNGPSPAIGATVRDTIPPEVLDVTWTCTASGGASCATPSGSGNVINTKVNLPPITTNPGAAVTFAIQGRLSPQARGSLTNTAVVDRPNDTTDPNPNNNTSTDIAPIQPLIDLELTKTILPPPPSGPGSVTFAINLRNRGPGDATGVVVTESLPAGMSYVGHTVSRGSYNSLSGVWTVGALAANEVATLQLTVNWNGTAARNTVEVTGADQTDIDSTPNNHNPAEDDQSSAELPTLIADLELSKIVNVQRVRVGENVTFTITLLNRGPAAATGVRVREQLPVGLDLVSAAPAQGSYDETSGQWLVGRLDPGQQTTLTIVARVLGVGPFANTAQVSASDQYDPDSTPNNDNPREDDQSSAIVEGEQVDLSLTKTVDTAEEAFPNVGQTIHYTVRLENAGPSTATGVQVADRLPAGLSFVSATPSQGSYDSTSGIWTVGTLAANASASLRVAATVTSSAPIVNTAQVSACDQPDIDSTPNNNDPREDDQASFGFTPQIADLAVSKVVNIATPPLGTDVVYTISLVNNGPNRATGVTVNEQLPAGVNFVSAVASQGLYDHTRSLWTVGSLDTGASVTLTIRATPTGAGPYRNTARVSHSDQFDPNPNNNTTHADIDPVLADLSLSKRASAARPDANGIITYTIVVHNDGPDGATGVVVSEDLPAGAVIVGTPVASQGTFAGATGLWTVGNLAVGGEATLTLTVNLSGATANYVNTAQVAASDQPDPDSTPGNNNPDEDDQARVILPSQADLELSKLAQTLPRVNGGVVYTLNLFNRGPDTATGVRVVDKLPAGLQFVAAAPSQGSFDPVSGEWRVGTLAAGATARLQISALFTTNDPVTNVAQVTASDQFDPDSAPNNNVPSEDDQASVTVSRLTAITLRNLSAGRVSGGVQVSWATGSELNSAGFQIYRAEQSDRAAAQRINPQLIVARGGANAGSDYSYLDTTALAGHTYYYWLVEVERGGATSEYGPVSSDPTLSGGPYKVYLAWLQ